MKFERHEISEGEAGFSYLGDLSTLHNKEDEIVTTNTILDQAEERITDVTTNAQSTRAQQIEAMREEIGRQYYEQAKAMLPKLESAIRQTHRPFLDRVARLETQAKAPLPTNVRAWLIDMANLCDRVPRTVRAGIEGWDQLTLPIWKDGKSPDGHAHVEIVGSIRNSLKNWDGCLTEIKSLTGRVEDYIQESGWPSKQPVTGA